MLSRVKLLFVGQRYPHSVARKSERNLSNLPPEILLSIIKFLPISGAASLTLCNHALLQALGTRYWRLLRYGNENENQREIFLSSLARDLPAHFFCYHCSRLHLRDKVGPPGPAFQPLNRLSCRNKHESIWPCFLSHRCDSDYRFVFPHLHLAMKRHRRGPSHGIPLDSLSFIEVQLSDDEREEDKTTTLLSVEARISSDEFYLRIQQWALISSNHRDLIPSRTRFV